MASIAHFEIPANDISRAQNFYSTLFDWKFEKAEGAENYFMANTKDPAKNCRIAIGLYRQDVQHPMPMIDYFSVSSVNSALKQVERLGGKIINPKIAAPGWGYYAVCQDTENNVFGLWEEDKSAK